MLIESEPICTLMRYLALTLFVISLGQNCIYNAIDKLQQGPHLKAAVSGVVSPLKAGCLQMKHCSDSEDRIKLSTENLVEEK